MTIKRDFRKELDSYQARRGTFRIVDVPPLRYLSLDGHGDPNTAALFTASLEALYPVAYALKFASKLELGLDYAVMPLEGLWWSDDMATFTSARDKSTWEWTLLMMVPDWITDDLFAKAVAKARSKNPEGRAGEITLVTLEEGRCVQTLHVGSYDDEAPVLAELHDRFIPENGLTMTGKHHEIYLSDARRTAPDKLRTILRQPVA